MHSVIVGIFGVGIARMAMVVCFYAATVMVADAAAIAVCVVTIVFVFVFLFCLFLFFHMLTVQVIRLDGAQLESFLDILRHCLL